MANNKEVIVKTTKQMKMFEDYLTSIKKQSNQKKKTFHP